MVPLGIIIPTMNLCVYNACTHTYIYIILYYIMYTSTWRDRDGSGQCLNPLTSQAIRNSCTWFDLTCGHFGPLVSFFAPTRNKHMPISCNKAAALNAYKYPTDGFPRGKTLCTTLVSKSTSYIYITISIYTYRYQHIGFSCDISLAWFSAILVKCHMFLDH